VCVAHPRINSLDPTKPGEMTYDELVSDYFKPQRSVIVERFKFNSRSRQSGESVAQFVAESVNIANLVECSRT